MSSSTTMTDTQALAKQRARARRMAVEGAGFLAEMALDDIKERLILVNRTFTEPAIIAPDVEKWAREFPNARVIPDGERLDLEPGKHDLVIHALSLHWSNDPVGQLIQARRALVPDGLFLGTLMGGQTLNELRSALAEAETTVTGGLSPRVLPMGDIRDLGALLQRAGFALPVADSFSLKVQYPGMLALMHDLRAMGETNAMSARNRTPIRRDVLERAGRIYATHFGRDGKIPATFEFIVLTGWAPSAEQPKPLRPGSAVQRLADALGTTEHPLDDKTNPGQG
jgi:SAM-dependent methyltransferase